MYIHSRRVRALWIVTLTVAFTIGITNVAAARVFRCASGDVFCLIGSIRSANERPGLHRIILEPGTYTLTVIDNTIDSELDGNALPSITSRLTIEGAGPEDTIIQAGEELFSFPFLRLFHVAATGDLSLKRLTIRHAWLPFDPGAAIFNRGTLRIAESRIVENSATESVGGGIFNIGRLHIVASMIANNDSEGCGGIAAFGTTTIADSTISHNEAFAAPGGGLCVGGLTTIINTTIANNSSTDFGNGGGVFASGTVRLINVTVADNVAEEAFGFGGGGGGGISVAGESVVEIQNTILAHNISLDSFDFPPVPNRGPDCLGTIISLGNNIIGDIADCSIDLAPTDYVGDPGLGEFVDDGTPGGGHIPLLADSPAIDAGDRRACPKRDQLGQRRVAADGTGRPLCDIGAVEFVPVMKGVRGWPGAGR